MNARIVVPTRFVGPIPTEYRNISIPISTITTGIHIPIPNKTALTNQEVGSGCESFFQM